MWVLRSDGLTELRIFTFAAWAVWGFEVLRLGIEDVGVSSV